MNNYPLTALYEQDIVAWANEQARLLRDKQFHLLDLEHLAEEIEDVGKSEQRELASRMAILLCHLLKWQYQPARQGSSWQAPIGTKRERIRHRLKKTLSLKTCLDDPDLKLSNVCLRCLLSLSFLIYLI